MIGLIGGSGLSHLEGLELEQQMQRETPFGEPSAPLMIGKFAGKDVAFIPRHGEHHTIPPHLINYRANIWAMHQLGVEQILAVASVGGITELYKPGVIALPDQLIDYSWGRESSFFSEDFSAARHIDFTYPFDETLRQQIQLAANIVEMTVIDGGTYAVTQGPRLETAAEIRRLKNDGADVVGMTAMPEAGLARELNIAYASIAVVANHAAGISSHPLSMEVIIETMDSSMHRVHRLLKSAIPLL
ncbi:S-methyl-5'-thioinosine phosphorylase [Methylophaga pinxianii]|uniref:S-methyl-5'-thioinosine phosphorylase n=1 Tax=Methylophaga pinxianii TaxID=2881052 RepID=UPI001CF2BF43|nr:S-methyl-5'-thioinosine phosphorylase [Methylophaga pinxianii]MCB2428336.1 S-methyl-5'-thioinosine phosphorylase [Methylophaga pinxianii]UPH45273.1 S-methyl-5'-thioinosine phosphorylase [Methylophaga pinxianii]